MAGIHVFVTGGIGGVHRGGEQTFDISADLMELGRTGSVAVVCSGVKSILDIRLTTEVLETQGVTVVTYGQKEFPAFFTRSSGISSHLSSNSLEDVADILKANIEMKLESGVMVAVPVPKEFEAPKQVEDATHQALQEAKDQKIKGKDVTPFLLERIAQLSGQESLNSNVALIKNNAQVGARLAVLVAGKKQAAKVDSDCSLLVIGGAARDLTFTAVNRFVAGESNPASHEQSSGGVGRNIAEALARICGGKSVAFASIVGRDSNGAVIVDELNRLDVDTSLIQHHSMLPTATYCAFLSQRGDLVGAMAAMEVLDLYNPELTVFEKDPKVVIFDCNFEGTTMLRILETRFRNAPLVWVDPTSASKCLRCLDLLRAGKVFGIAPNEMEMEMISSALGGKSLFDFGVEIVVQKLGAKGIKIMRRGHSSDLLVPAPTPAVGIVSVTGAGDVCIASIVAALHIANWSDWTRITSFANRNVERTLASIDAVPDNLERI